MSFTPTVSDYLDSIDGDWVDLAIPLSKGVKQHGAGYLSHVFSKRRGTRRQILPEGESRCDSYPEGTEYKDEGCDLAPSCLACPFTRCRYDMPGGMVTARSASRQDTVISLVKSGMSVRAAAASIGISARMAMRYVAVAGSVSALRPKISTGGRRHAS